MAEKSSTVRQLFYYVYHIQLCSPTISIYYNPHISTTRANCWHCNWECLRSVHAVFELSHWSMPKASKFSVKPSKLPNTQAWLASRDSEVKIYFYHVKTKISQILSDLNQYAVTSLLSKVLRGGLLYKLPNLDQEIFV